MSWDATKDIMNSFIGILFLGVPLVIVLWKQRKNETEKAKKKKILFGILIIIVGCSLLVWLGIDKITRDKETENNFNTYKKETNKKLDYLVSKTESDSAYQQKIKDKYHIFPNEHNEPIEIKNVYNTTTGNVENLDIGTKYKN